jgi:hypothetical protein
VDISSHFLLALRTELSTYIKDQPRAKSRNLDIASKTQMEMVGTSIREMDKGLINQWHKGKTTKLSIMDIQILTVKGIEFRQITS